VVHFSADIGAPKLMWNGSPPITSAGTEIERIRELDRSRG
jgi:hypothetical protein